VEQLHPELESCQTGPIYTQNGKLVRQPVKPSVMHLSLKGVGGPGESSAIARWGNGAGESSVAAGRGNGGASRTHFDGRGNRSVVPVTFAAGRG